MWFVVMFLLFTTAHAGKDRTYRPTLRVLGSVAEQGEPIWARIGIRGCVIGGRRMATRPPPPDPHDRSPNPLIVTNAAGEVVPDPFRAPYMFPAGGSFVMGKMWLPCGYLIDLNRFAWFDEPGVYRVRLRDHKWSARLRIEVPTDRLSVVRAHARRIGDRKRDMDFYDALGHPEYVPILESLAEKMPANVTLDELDERAILGIAACPCAEATDALLRLYDRFEDRDVRALLGRELALRAGSEPYVDSPYTEGEKWAYLRRELKRVVWFRAHAFAERHREPIRQRAVQALESGRHESWATDALRLLITPADATVAYEQLDEALGRQDARAVRDLDALLIPLRGGPVPDGLSPDTTLYLRLGRLWQMAVPDSEWNEIMLSALATDNELVRRQVGLVLSRWLHQPSDALVARLIELIEPTSPERADWSDRAISQYIAGHPDERFEEPVREILHSGENVALPYLSWLRAATALGIPRDEQWRILVNRLGPDDPVSNLLFPLVRAFESHGGGGLLGPAEIERLKSGWNAFIDLHQDGIRDGSLLEDETFELPDELIPSTFVMGGGRR